MGSELEAGEGILEVNKGSLCLFWTPQPLLNISTSFSEVQKNCSRNSQDCDAADLKAGTLGRMGGVRLFIFIFLLHTHHPHYEGFSSSPSSPFSFSLSGSFSVLIIVLMDLFITFSSSEADCIPIFIILIFRLAAWAAVSIIFAGWARFVSNTSVY